MFAFILIRDYSQMRDVRLAKHSVVQFIELVVGPDCFYSSSIPAPRALPVDPSNVRIKEFVLYSLPYEIEGRALSEQISHRG